jgi:ribulose-5-phosphate 4-epimerase/fuculose-1-phosphate aldolase
MEHADARAEICRLGKSLFDRAYLHGTTGNISIKLDRGYLITPTDACLGFLDPDELSLVDENGVQVAGARASKTLALHRRIYTADPAAICIIHTHSRELVLASLTTTPGQDLVPPITPYFVMKVGHVPLIPYAAPGDEITARRTEQAIATAASIGTPIRAVMLDRLGPNVWNTTPARAMATLEELEETALLWNRAHPPPLDSTSIQELRDRFGAFW